MMTPEDKLATRYSLAKKMVEEGTASPQVKQAVDLLLAGKRIREIAAELGVSVSRAGDVLKDPDGAQGYERRHRRHGICCDCGSKTFSGGGIKVPLRCSECAPEHRKQVARTNIILAIAEWARLYGAPPSALDWNVHQARLVAHPDRLAEILDRHRGQKWPPASSVQAAFGTWNAAIAAAGYRPLNPSERRDPERWRRHLADSARKRSAAA